MTHHFTVRLGGWVGGLLTWGRGVQGLILATPGGAQVGGWVGGWVTWGRGVQGLILATPGGARGFRTRDEEIEEARELMEEGG